MSFVDWDFNLLESLIQDRGDTVIWEMAIACPNCRRDDAMTSFNEVSDNEATRIRKVNCNKCHGTGFFYRNAQMVKGLLTQLNPGNRSLMNLGNTFPGDCVFSPSLQGPALADMDKVTLCVTDVLHEGQTIQRGAAHMSNARFIPDDLAVEEDRLWYSGDGCAHWCEDANNVVYDVGADFIIVDNVIRWTGRRPAEGVFYTLKYTYYPEFIVYASPLQRVDRGRDLQQRVVLRKKHIAMMNNQTPTPADRQTEQLSLTGRLKI